MKIIILLFIGFLCSCKTMKIDSTGNKKPTGNTRHIEKVTNHKGFWTGKGYVEPVTRKKQ